ncbi:hypothetical protein EYF80_016494 [Liparis tanakae]|uniref:Uncharacterized protein n=1 Tax=Liparis tanakae TaxID=230148 RepID=A0A4Z2I6G7_9TELE|nr:hypothetical protein EYF80_016494 [Liparis tanakae]
MTIRDETILARPTAVEPITLHMTGMSSCVRQRRSGWDAFNAGIIVVAFNAGARVVRRHTGHHKTVSLSKLGLEGTDKDAVPLDLVISPPPDDANLFSVDLLKVDIPPLYLCIAKKLKKDDLNEA